MSKVKKEKAEGNRKKEAKKYKNKCRRLREKKRRRKETGKRRLKNIKINAGACASGLPSPDDSVVDLSLHGRGIYCAGGFL